MGRPPVKVSQLLKLDPKDLAIERQLTPAAAPGADAGVYAVYGVGVDDRNGTVWTTNTRQNTVAVYRQSDLGLVKQFEPGLVPHAHTVVVDEKLERAFASAAMTPDIVSFDAKTPAVRKHITIESGVRGEQFAVVGMHLDPTVHKLYAVSLKTNEAAVIDAKTEQVEKVFPIQGAKTPMGVAHDPQTDRLFITAQGSDNLLIVDAKTGKTLHNVTPAPGAERGLRPGQAPGLRDQPRRRHPDRGRPGRHHQGQPGAGYLSQPRGGGWQGCGLRGEQGQGAG